MVRVNRPGHAVAGSLLIMKSAVLIGVVFGTVADAADSDVLLGMVPVGAVCKTSLCSVPGAVSWAVLLYSRPPPAV